MSVTRWLALVCTVVTVACTTGCDAILGEFTSATADSGSPGVDSGITPPPPTDAGGKPDGNVATPDANPGDDSAVPPADAGGDTSVACGANQKDCNGTCVSATDVANSCATPGVCGPCSLPNAIPATSCVNGACAIASCVNGFTDCNGLPADGCEIHTGNDPLNCGACMHKCNATNGQPVCAGGTCTDINCNPGFADCDNNATNGCETNIVTPTNCGTCGYLCGTANGTPSCVEAGDAGADAGSVPVCSFACTAPYAHCPGSADKAGCDVDTATDNNNCGSCGHVCGLGQACTGGQCACNPTTCPKGCCDSTGACVTSSTTACGAGGNACVGCAAGQECNAAGVCVCDATSCKNGCCTSAGVCVTTAADVSCGKGGALCSDCTKTSLACSTDGTQCQCTTTSCSGGCCNGNTCVPVASQNTSECGTGGNACGTCASGQACVSGGCSCGGGACGGCCASGSCVTPGVTACGANGGVCAACGANQECNAQGQCVCDATTCPNGCCTATVGGTCITTELPGACGSGGALCSTCATGTECAKSGTTNQYSCTCDAKSCAKGCCNGNTCVPYASEGPSECGTAGAQCGSCSQGTYCSTGGVCTCDGTSCTGCCQGGVTGTCQASNINNCGIKGASCNPCSSGQSCNANGQCQCDGTSCTGCCSALIGGTCNSGKTNPACGTGGGLCGSCANGSGTECNGVQCVCDSNACSTGCCSGNTCNPGTAFGACGSGGNTCNPCVSGQHCGVAGGVNECLCDGTSCTTGCCTTTGNGTCTAYAAELDTLCGALGAVCTPCPSGESCNKANGVCGCTAAACPNGCCDSNGACQTSGNTTCGTGGTACANCQSSGVACVSGACQQTLSVKVTGSGTVSSTPAGINNCAATCAAPFNYGSSVTLTPTPATGYSFSGWSGACSGSGPCVVAMNGAASVTATFTIQSFTLTTATIGNGSGTITSSPAGINCGGGGACTAPYQYNTPVTLTPTAGAQSTFTGWTGACSGTGACIVTMSSAQSVSATFTLKQYALSVSFGGNGSGTVASTDGGINCGGTCGANYNYNTSVTLTATPATGSSFTSWGGSCSGTSTTCVVAVTQAVSAVANFALQIETLTIKSAGTGTGTTSLNTSSGNTFCGSGGCAVGFSYGTSVTVVPTAATGSIFAGWAGACSGNAGCIVPMTGAQTVIATFTLIPETVSVTSTYGTVTSTPAGINCGATCSAPFDYGTAVKLTAAPFAGWAFTGWTGGGCPTGPVPCTVNPTAAVAVTANYQITSVVFDPAWSPTLTYGPGDLTVTGATVNTTTNARTNVPINGGTFYWEVTVNAASAPPSNNGGLGISGAGFNPTACYAGQATVGCGNGLSFGYGCCASWFPYWTGTVTEPAGGPPASSEVNTGNVYMFALNASSGNMWVGNNGAWYNAGNPSTNAAPAIVGLSAPIYPDLTFYSASPDSYTGNFGNAPFKYPVPTGFVGGVYPKVAGFSSISPCTNQLLSPNFLLGEAITLPGPMTVTTLSVVLTTATPAVNGLLALYTSVGGTPGTLLVNSASTALVAGENRIGVTPTPLAAGTYFIMGDYSGGGGNSCADTATTNGLPYIALTEGTAPPATFGSPLGTIPNDFHIAYYVLGY